MKVLFDDPWFDGQLLRVLGYVYYGGADVGDCLSTARRIVPDDPESWQREWFATAERIYAAAKESHARGHRVSAREGYLRAASYFRASYIFLYGAPVDPRLVDAFNRQ